MTWRRYNAVWLSAQRYFSNGIWWFVFELLKWLLQKTGHQIDLIYFAKSTIEMTDDFSTWPKKCSPLRLFNHPRSLEMPDFVYHTAQTLSGRAPEFRTSMPKHEAFLQRRKEGTNSAGRKNKHCRRELDKNARADGTSPYSLAVGFGT